MRHSRALARPLQATMNWPCSETGSAECALKVATQRLQAEGLAPSGTRSRATNRGGRRAQRGTGRCQPCIDPQSALPWSQQARKAAFAVDRQTREEEAQEQRPARRGIACSDVCKQASERRPSSKKVKQGFP